MKLLLVIIILAIFQTGCKQCGRYATFGECDGQITGDATPAEETPAAPATPSYTLSGTSFNIAENAGTATYTVVLGSQPTSAVTVNISSADATEIAVSPSSLSFSTSNYSVAQTVTMTGVNDNISDGNQSVTITNSISSSDSDYAALDNQTVTAVNVDDDTVAMTVSNLSTSSFREIANSSVISTDNYTIVLGSQPSSDVTVNIASSDTTEVTVSPSSVVFGSGNYSIARTIVVSAVHDDEDDGDVAGVTITNSISTSDSDYAALDNHTKTLTIVDVDAASLRILGSVYGPYVEGVAGPSWRISLSTKPTDNVTITMEEDRPNQFTFPSAITFTPSNYSTEQLYTPTATNDNIIEGTHFVGLRVKATSNDSNYNNKYTRAPDAEVTDNGTGKQANNHISAGNYFVLAVDKVYSGNRVLYAWGDDTCGVSPVSLTAESYGQCDYVQDNLSRVSDYGSGQMVPRTADNSSIGDNSSNVPILTGLTNIGRMASMSSHSCALFDNRTAIQCWGRYRMSNHPHAVANNWTRQNSFTARDIDVGYEHAAIILDNGSAVAWGYSRNAATGNGDRTVYGWEGGVVLSGVKDIALGTHHSCYLFDNGTATCVGKNERKQLGSSVDTSNGCGTGVECSETFVTVEGFNNIVQIDAGNRHTVGLLDNGSAICWGEGSSGQCGIGTTPGQVNPPTVMSSAPANILKVWANGSKTCVATNKYKTLHCTGSTFTGDGSSTAQANFVEVDFPSSFTSNHRILDVALTSGGGAVYTENIVNAYNGPNYITYDVFTWGSFVDVIGAGNQAVPVRTPIQIGSPF